MTTNDYSALIQEFAQLIGLPEQAERIRTTGNLCFRDVALTLFFDEGDTQQVNVFIDFGAVPEDRALQVLRRLLEINLLLAPQGSPRLGLDPETGRVVFNYAQPLQALTARKLLGGIDMAVRQAGAWRDRFFLEERASGTQLRDALRV